MVSLGATTDAFHRLETEGRTYCRQLPVVFEQGAVVSDENAREYLDFFSGAGAVNYGHNEPRMTQAILDHIAADKLLHALDLHTGTKRDLLEAFEQKLFEPNGWDFKVQLKSPINQSQRYRR